MTRPATISLGLLLLLIGYTAAGPESELQPRAVRSSACQDHSTLHDRLDVVEKRVEDTVQKLEDELAVLLDAIEAPEWSPCWKLLENLWWTSWMARDWEKVAIPERGEQRSLLRGYATSLCPDEGAPGKDRQ